MRVVTVLKSGGDFAPVHVQALQQQVLEYAPFAEFECLTNIVVPGVQCRSLKRNWPGWWSKLELFDPELPGDFLFMDLDTVIVGPLDDFENVTELTLLRDFYRDGKKLREGLGGGLIYLPDAARKPVWDFFSANPMHCMTFYRGGDQFLFERFYMKSAKRWQDVLPGQVVSYKVHCQKGVPADARVICFHGQPRPWGTAQFTNLYR